jgi:hypothetical protein
VRLLRTHQMVVAGCGDGWEGVGKFGRERGRENLEEREKMKRNPKLKSTWFGFFFFFLG